MRRRLLAMLAAALPVKAQHAREVRVTIPHFQSSDLNSVLSTFFSKGDEPVKRKLESILNKSDDLTLVLTTKTVGDNAIQIEVL